MTTKDDMPTLEEYIEMRGAKYYYDMAQEHLRALHAMKHRADKLAAQAQAVIDRWETPAWKEAKHTGKFIAGLCGALSEYMETTTNKETP